MTVSTLPYFDAPAMAGDPDTPVFQAICLSAYRNRRTCAAILLTCWLLAASIISLSPTTYEASSQVLLEPLPRKPISVVLDGVADPLDSAQADSRLQVVKSERLLRFVFNTIDWPKLSAEGRRPSDESRLYQWLKAVRAQFYDNKLDAQARQTQALLDFMNRVSVKRLGLSYVIDITFRAPTPRLAASVTNSITAAYLRSLVISSQLEDELLQRRLTNVESEKQVLLDAVRKGIVPEENFPDANARVISMAFEPLSKSSPKSLLIFLMATVVGIVGGLFMSFSRYRADRSIRTGRERFIPSGAQLLAICPKRERGAAHLAKSETGSNAGLGCLLMQRLLGRAEAGRHNIIGFVAYGPQSGTTHVVDELATELSGTRTQPRIIEVTQSPAIERCAVETIQAAAGDKNGRKENAKPVRRFLDTADMIDAGKLEANLKDLASSGPVLIDLPALKTSLDALAVVPHLDMLVLVTDAGRTTLDELIEAYKLAEGQRMIGFVLNRGKRWSRRGSNSRWLTGRWATAAAWRVWPSAA